MSLSGPEVNRLPIQRCLSISRFFSWPILGHGINWPNQPEFKSRISRSCFQPVELRDAAKPIGGFNCRVLRRFGSLAPKLCRLAIQQEKSHEIQNFD